MKKILSQLCWHYCSSAMLRHKAGWLSPVIQRTCGNWLFEAKLKECRSSIPNLISRRQFNDRRKSVSGLCEQIRSRIANRIDGGEDYFCIKNWKPTFIPFANARKRVETLFSQLTDQFLVIRNYAKETCGLFARIVGKVSAMTALQYIYYINSKPIGRIKYALI